MRLNSALCYRHAKYYYFAPTFKWGLPKYRESGYKHWRRQMLLHKNLPVVDYASSVLPTLPSGYQVENPVDVVKEDFLNFRPFYEKQKPWPFNQLNPAGTVEDSNFKEERALVFDRRFVILEGYKGAMNFSNTVLEADDQLPSSIVKLEQSIELPDSALSMLQRRLDWSTKTDGFNKQLKRQSIFPKMHEKPPRTFGPHCERVESNILNSYYDVSDVMASRLSDCFDRRKIISPECSLAFNRNDFKVITDLRCDFVTLTPVSGANLLQNLSQTERPVPLFCEQPSLTKGKQVVDIQPANWEICFEKTHFYPDQVDQSPLPSGSDVHTIFLSTSHNSFKPMPDRFLKGRAAMFMYGYAVRQARKLYGNPEDYKSPDNYKQLDTPITIQSVFINQLKKNIGFGCFQLNTLAFDSEIKNQLWFDGMYSLENDPKLILKKLTALQLSGYNN